MVVVHVTVDETSKAPGHYRTLADQNGQFCVVVSTTHGTATAEVKGALPTNAKALAR